ncbi:cation:proton antiporter [Haloferax namakaokahaiae]|uniref:Cation:proton antiporter n=1 Tax=Haloferax namakaokahaiae TaxID=1748331 RepID=A0ABD5ZJ14_9EURY
MATVIEPLSHYQLLLVVAQLLVLLAVARLFGEAFSKIGQPAVIGELLAGVLLGPSVLGLVAPGVYGWLFAVSESQFHLLEVIAWVGLIMLLIVTGLETDLDLIVSKGRTAVLLSLGGIIVPFTTGFALGWMLPLEFVAAPDQRLVFSLFIATAMSISAIPVIAKILIELDVIRRDIGQLILAAGMVDDTIGWILLATVAGLAQSGVADIDSALVTVVSVVVFLGLAFTVGQRFVSSVMRWVDTNTSGETSMITALVVLALAAAAITQFLGLEAILGAFVVGVLVGGLKRFDHRLRRTFEVMTLGVFAPVFFAIAGLRMNVTTLFDPTVALVGVVVLAVACFGKFAGVLGVSRLAGLSYWEAITIGGGMNARGAMEIIVATVGLGLGILTIETYSIIVVVAIVTSLMAPPVMRWSLEKVEMSAEERARLDREQRRTDAFVASLGRVLLPTRCSPASQFAAQLVGAVVRDEDIEVTTMFVHPSSQNAATGHLARTARRLGLPVRVIPFFSDSSTNRAGDNRSEATGPDRELDVDADAAADSETDVDLLDESPTEAPADDPSRCLSLTRFQLDLPKARVRTITRSASPSATEIVLAESVGHDLLVLGSVARGGAPGEAPFGAVIDEVVRDASCPVLLVRAPAELEETIVDPVAIERILLPTTGTQYNRRAAEFAFAIARSYGASVEVVTVIDSPPAADRFVGRSSSTAARTLGEKIVDAQADLGQSMGVVTTTAVIETERTPHEVLVERANTGEYDLLVLGGSTRLATERAFLGHRVEHVLRNADCPVVVFTSQ